MCTEILWDDRVLVDSKSGSPACVPELVIDSGAASNVVGRNWISAWRKWGNVTSKLALKPSTRKFRFGSGMIHPSEGTTELCGWLWVVSDKTKGKRAKRPFNIVCDVVNLSIPLFMSLNTTSASLSDRLRGWEIEMGRFARDQFKDDGR